MPTKSEEALFSASTQPAMETYGEQVVAPILVDYVEWVLEQAQVQGLQRLYFLARDGHILQKLATLLCRQRGLSIECRYLYCSRFALRTAAYHLMTKEAILSVVGENCVRCTPRVLFERSNLTHEQMLSLAKRCNCAELDAPLSAQARLSLVKRLGDSSLYLSYLKENAAKAYDKAMAYFRQEGLLDGDVAVVDSGWSGSMQRSLGQLLRSKGFSHRLEGFYFGMYQSPKCAEDGTYHTFYFNRQGKLADKAWFNNNFFECMLAAPHGMTVGYEACEGEMVPLLREKRGREELALVQAQEAGILRYAQNHLSQSERTTQSERLLRCRARLRRCMVHPTAAEVELLSNFQFCDDATEGYFYPLARAERMGTLNTRLLPVRILQKVTTGRLVPYQPFVWYYGSVVGAPKWLQPLYRWNEFLWECVRLSR